MAVTSGSPHSDDPSSHFRSGGFCGVCGSVWPCATARRSWPGPSTASGGISLSAVDPGVGERRRRPLPPVGQRTTATRRPTVLGYVQLRPGLAATSVATGMARLESFARAQGWALGEVFVDDDPHCPLLAWGSLLVTARHRRPAAVVVPDVEGLGPGSADLDALRARLTHDVGVPLVITTLP